MTMIEKVARAIQECSLVTGYEARLPEAKLYAKAAIEAMREPSMKMLDAGTDCAFTDEKWNAMIDAALKE